MVVDKCQVLLAKPKQWVLIKNKSVIIWSCLSDQFVKINRSDRLWKFLSCLKLWIYAFSHEMFKNNTSDLNIKYLKLEITNCLMEIEYRKMDFLKCQLHSSKLSDLLKIRLSNEVL